MRIVIDAPPVRSLSANEKMVYQFLKQGLTPIEIARRMKLPVGKNNFSDNRYDVPNETITRLITSIREKGWDIPTNNNKEEAEMQKLTEEDKRSIVTANSAGATVSSLAEKYNVSKSAIYNVIKDFNNRGESALSGETEVETKEEPATAATETGSDSEIVEENISEDIIPETKENVKPVIPQAVIEACWGRKEELKEQIAQEQAVIDDWKRQIAEIDDFLDLAKLCNPMGGAV